jgi:cytochrome c oxidase subunit 2
MMHLGLLIELLGIPPNVAEGGYVIDSMLEMVHWFMLALFVGWGSFYFYAIYHFRQSNHPKANYHGVKSHLPTKLEGGILILEVVLLMGFAAPIWAERVDNIPNGRQSACAWSAIRLELSVRWQGRHFGKAEC